MDERTDLELALLAERRKLAELRALRERVKHNRLEDDDWTVLRALISQAIEEAEPGQQWVTIGPADETDGVENSAPERLRR